MTAPTRAEVEKLIAEFRVEVEAMFRVEVEAMITELHMFPHHLASQKAAEMLYDRLRHDCEDRLREARAEIERLKAEIELMKVSSLARTIQGKP